MQKRLRLGTRTRVGWILLVAFPLLVTATLAFHSRLEPLIAAPPIAEETAAPDLVAPSRFDGLIRKYARRYGVEPALVKAVMHVESGFRTRVRSLAGARGLMQVMPRTGRAYGARNLYDPNENVRAGVRHLRYLLERHHNDATLAVAAYNAGSRTVCQYGGVPPFPETRHYVETVLRYRRSYHAQMTVVSRTSLDDPRS